MGSLSSGAFNIFMQIIKLGYEANSVQESLGTYSLTCFMARIGWVPHRVKTMRILENEKVPESSLCACICTGSSTRLAADDRLADEPMWEFSDYYSLAVSVRSKLDQNNCIKTRLKHQN